MTKLIKQEIEKEREMFEWWYKGKFKNSSMILGVLDKSSESGSTYKEWSTEKLFITWLARRVSKGEVRGDLNIIDGLVYPSIICNRGELGKYLAKMRVDLNLTQNQLAKFMGMSGSMLSSIERRKKPISKKQLDNFIHEMGLDDNERYEFTKLAIMHNLAIEAEKNINKLL